MLDNIRICWLTGISDKSKYNKTVVVRNNSSLINNFFSKTQTLQLFTMNIKQILFTKVILKSQTAKLGLKDIEIRN